MDESNNECLCRTCKDAECWCEGEVCSGVHTECEDHEYGAVPESKFQVGEVIHGEPVGDVTILNRHYERVREDWAYLVQLANGRKGILVDVSDFFGEAGAVRPGSECAWCGKLIRLGPEPLSHDICEDCAAREFQSFSDQGLGMN